MKPNAAYRALARVDAYVNRAYTARWNPLYHSGAIAVALLLVLIGTGVYLLFFYRLGAPYESVAAINGQAWSGRWIRGLHRFASDATLIAVAVHAFRMYAQRRSWGPRALAWISGVALVGLVLLSGWSGYILVWDAHAQLLATEIARLLDAVPVFSEPLSRSFSGEYEVPNAFFFITLFLHIALPLSIGLLIWVHVARVARPVLLPARPVLWGVAGTLALIAVVWPLPMERAADLLHMPEAVGIDGFFSFWVPITRGLSPWPVWVAVLAITLLALAVPWLTRPRLQPLSAPATVNERACTGCEQCVRDCPYDAIEMIARTDGRDGSVAKVRSELCTSCGICVGSCPPMAIGPGGVTARDQLAEVRAFIAAETLTEDNVVIVGCAWSAARVEAERHGARLLTVPCVGAMHTSTVELLLRGGAGGVLVVGCPEHDGRTREGVTWTAQRLFQGRRADLKARADARRVRLVQANVGECARLHDAVLAFGADIDALNNLSEEERIDLVGMCRSNGSRRSEAGR